MVTSFLHIGRIKCFPAGKEKILYIELYIILSSVSILGKVIMVSDEIYEKLKRMKRPGESFSDVIGRLLSYKPKLSEIAGSGTISSSDWERVKEVFRKRDELDEIRRRYLLGLIGE